MKIPTKCENVEKKKMKVSDGCFVLPVEHKGVVVAAYQLLWRLETATAKRVCNTFYAGMIVHDSSSHLPFPPAILNAINVIFNISTTTQTSHQPSNSLQNYAAISTDATKIVSHNRVGHLHPRNAALIPR